MLAALRHGQGHAVGGRRHAAGISVIEPSGQRGGLALQVETAAAGHALAHFFRVVTFHLVLGRHRQHQPFVLAGMQCRRAGEDGGYGAQRQHTHC